MVQTQNERVEEFNDGKKYQVLKSGPIIDKLQATGVKDPVVICGKLSDLVLSLNQHDFMEVPQICTIDSGGLLTSQTNDQLVLRDDIQFSTGSTIFLVHEALELDDGQILFTGMKNLGDGKSQVTCGIFADRLDEIVIVKKPHPIDSYPLSSEVYQARKLETNLHLKAYAKILASHPGVDIPKLLSIHHSTQNDTVLVLKNDYICQSPNGLLSKFPTFEFTRLSASDQLRACLLQFAQMKRWLGDSLIFVDWQDDIKVTFDKDGNSLVGLREVDFEAQPHISSEFSKSSERLINSAFIARGLQNTDSNTISIIRQSVRQNGDKSPKFSAENYYLSSPEFSQKLIDFTKQNVPFYQKINSEFLGFMYKRYRELLLLDSDSSFDSLANHSLLTNVYFNNPKKEISGSDLKQLKEQIINTMGITEEEIANERVADEKLHTFFATNHNCNLDNVTEEDIDIALKLSHEELEQKFQEVNNLLGTKEAELLGYQMEPIQNGADNIPNIIARIDGYTISEEKSLPKKLFSRTEPADSVKAFVKLRLQQLAIVSDIPVPNSLTQDLSEQKVAKILSKIEDYLDKVRIKLGLQKLKVFEGQNELVLV